MRVPDCIAAIDGSYWARERKGAGAFVLFDFLAGEVREKSFLYPHCTSPLQAESLTLHELMCWVRRASTLRVITDSMELVCRSGQMLDLGAVAMEHTYGHVGHPLNERADTLAKRAIRRNAVVSYRVEIEDYLQRIRPHPIREEIVAAFHHHIK